MNFVEAILLFIRDQIARPAIGGHDADHFVPLLWTMFLFILGLNLFGLLPWAGSPTGALGVTAALAAITFGTVIISGSAKFGVAGFWLNQVPHMDLPWYAAPIIKPLVWVIEVVGLLIKHGVLAVRLLANMVAGHLVLLGIMGLAFTVSMAANPSWWIAAPAAVIGSAAVQLAGTVCSFLAGLHFYVFVRAVYRCRSASPLTVHHH